MSRIGVAFRSFFGLLFGGTLPADAASFLPSIASPRGELPEPSAAAETPSAAKDTTRLKPVRAKEDSARQHRERGALLALGLLQREGRLIDFLRESLDDHDDAAIGAAVRDIHRGCSRVLSDHFEIEPVMPGEEDSEVQVREGFDPTEIRLIGEVKGSPPFRGTLRHHGWRATKIKLPSLTGDVDRNVLAPAEVEIV